ncbi:hypothetical protein BGZ73_001326 [Actinomortierella ambigua]|nr:hypothetical protein BGZ73_001326 [Actinomortierella ambigua]
MGAILIMNRRNYHRQNTPTYTNGFVVICTGTTAMRLKYLRTKPRKVVEASPCIAEMGALIQCWTASGVDDAKCMQSVKMLSDCMKNLPTKTKKMNTMNYHLARLQKQL